jgi:hypothetical protein
VSAENALTEFELHLKRGLEHMEHRIINTILGEIGKRFGEVNGRLDRAGAKAIAGLAERTSKRQSLR